MLALAATLAIQALVAMATLSPPILAPLAAPAIGVAASSTGLFTALIYVGASIASLTSGALLRRFGAMRLSQLGLVACSVGIALIASARLPLVVLAAVILGLGYGPVTPASSHILVRQSPAGRRALIFSIKQTGVPLGGVLAGAIVPVLVLAFGWRVSALAVGAAGLVVAIAVQPLRWRFDAPDEGAGKEAEAPPPWRGVSGGIRLVLGIPNLRRLALASFSFSAAQLSFSTFLVTYLTEQIGEDLVAAGAVLAVAQTAGIGARILWGWLADRLIGPPLLLALLGFAMGGATVAVGLFGTDWPRAAIMAVAIVHGATGIGWNGVYLSEVARLAPAGNAGAATGGALAVTFLGIVVGPALFSVVVATTASYRLAFFMIAIGACLGGLACLAARRRAL
jgi:MFS family permease